MQLTRQYPAESYRSNYNYYDCDKYSGDYLYPVRQVLLAVSPAVLYRTTQDVLGNWKHYSLSRDTLRERNERATSPLVARELTRYGCTVYWLTLAPGKSQLFSLISPRCVFPVLKISNLISDDTLISPFLSGTNCFIVSQY